MNNNSRFQLFRWQFWQLWKINLLITLAIGAYVLMRVVPFSRPELLLFVCVTIHSALVVRKLSSASAIKSKLLYSKDLTRDQIWWQTFFASVASGLLVYGTAFLLMWLQIRSAVQEHLVNPYFPIFATKELWVPGMWMLTYLLVMPLFHYAFIRGRQAWRNRGSGWATLLVGLGLFSWYTSKMALGTYTSTDYLIFASCHVPAAVVLIVATWRMHRTMELAV